MNIIGKKVILRAIEKVDNAVLREIINDPEIEKMLGGISFPISEAIQEQWFGTLSNNSSMLRCIVADKNTPDEAIGTVILSDIDYINGTAQIHIKLINSDKRNCGYGYDSVTVITQYAFDTLRLHCIFANVISYNEPSMKLFEKCGYKKDGELKERIYKLGKYWNVVAFSIQNNEV